MKLRELLTALALTELSHDRGRFEPHKAAWLEADVLVEVGEHLYDVDAQRLEWQTAEDVPLEEHQSPYTLVLRVGTLIT